MTVFDKLLDSFTLKGRLLPALVAVFPVGLAVGILFPELLDIDLATVGGLGTGALLIVLATFARDAGFKRQPKLLALWGGMPTTYMLRHRDSALDQITKQRYHAFLSRAIGVRFPTPDEERENSEYADNIYGSAVKYLAEMTRDTKRYLLVYQQNVGYSFRRNLWGLKFLGLLFTTVLTAIGVGVIARGWSCETVEFHWRGVIIVSAGIVFFWFWLMIVNPGFVRLQAEAYARALLGACDTLNNDA